PGRRRGYRVRGPVGDVHSPLPCNTAPATTHPNQTTVCHAATTPATPRANAPMAGRTVTAALRSRDIHAGTSMPAPRHCSRMDTRRATSQYVCDTPQTTAGVAPDHCAQLGGYCLVLRMTHGSAAAGRDRGQ